MPRLTPRSPLFPYTTLFRSQGNAVAARVDRELGRTALRLPPKGDEHLARADRVSGGRGSRHDVDLAPRVQRRGEAGGRPLMPRSEEHTSELQSLTNLVCRLL